MMPVPVAPHRALPASVPGDTAVPVDPEADEAREWILRELSDREYLEAQPSWFDRLASSLWEWLTSLDLQVTGGGQGLGLVLVLLLIAGILVAAFFIFGKPALDRRSRVAGELFGVDDERDAATIRRAAERSAADGRWVDAVTDMFRSIARGLAERTIVNTLPGTTAQDFAERAAAAFPEHRGAIASAADDFDGVRYLEHEGSHEQYERIATLERTLRTARPAVDLAAADSGSGRGQA
jgi:hypothetical protein